ncbi:MAG TPA: prepilin-type N-terminal cleavage/methylation domain-containing protein [Bryobacteraceae bacterium]|nr:prepilin-type N-terminal cleavage/methylation domain-containing protein [Bryobacteraceae bacterium]
MRRRNQRGVTLLELLVAVTIMALLSLGVLYAMRVGLNAMGKTNDRFSKNRRVLGVERALTAQIAGLMPVTAECIGAEGGPAGKAVMFQGDPSAMRFVSSYSLMEGARGYPKLLEFTVIAGENGRGVRLIVNEMPFATPYSIRGVCVGQQANPETGQSGPMFAPIASRPDSFILADKLASVRFLYLETLPPPILQRWTPKWIANKLPAAIRLELIPLDLDAADLHVTSTTVPIRITANPMFTYGD